MSLSIVSPPAIVSARVFGVNEVLRWVVAVACAGSVGVHVAIIPEHLSEGALGEVVAFAATSAVLGLLALIARDPRYDGWAPFAAAGSLAAVAIAYFLSRTTGLPPIVDDPEPFDVTGLATSAAELVGAVAGFALTARTRKEHR